MTDTRPHHALQSSYSYAGPSLVADTSRATLKRRASDVAQDPCQHHLHPPPPPQPYPIQYVPGTRSGTSARQIVRTQSLVVPHQPAMDPTPDDPGAIFIHPPYTDFPNAHLYKDGLTYTLMAANPEWFLDPADYITAVDSNPNAVRYPTQLEPPRGWCPTKKREMKDGWPEGEEPRLRCTFCRRTYAGVNAKSMWRRHVYEKHRIAMSNRRDNNNTSERRGRGSNKENKERAGPARGGMASEDDTVDAIKRVPSQKPPDTALAKDAFSHHDQSHETEQNFDVPAPNLTMVASSSSFIDSEHDVFHVGTSSSTPPLTPGISPLARQEAKVIPESPYNPLLTPSFKHSPARLPSEQPWRFPSPSHPLHSSARELSLYMLVRGEASPMVSGLDVSPVVIVPKSERRKRSIFSSPAVPDPDDKDTHSDGGESSKRPAPKPLKRRLFGDSGLPTPFTDRVKFQQHRIPESPLGKQFSKPKDLMSIVLGGESWRLTPAKTPAKSSWRTPGKTPGKSPGLLGPIQLDGEDPFALSWSTPIKAGFLRPLSPPDSGSEPDSPVLRSSQFSQSESGNTSFSTSDGFGVGLMEAFTLKDNSDLMKTPSSDDLMFVYDNNKSKSKANADSKRSLLDISLGSPPAQAGRKTSRRYFSSDNSYDDDGGSEMQETSQPKKRRRTVSGRH
ncbi:hypothetical protein QCA50_002076 [Cerrena zonata]|uniref:Uncharacterized protein n=1 Tax=Cerrena zonata TaxID=2478898 RepID=A0AAW0GMN9_9APHY